MNIQEKIKTGIVGAGSGGFPTHVKAAKLQPIESQLAMTLVEKAFVTLKGEVTKVRTAEDAGAEVIAKKGLLVNKVVIPQPRKELPSEII